MPLFICDILPGWRNGPDSPRGRDIGLSACLSAIAILATVEALEPARNVSHSDAGGAKAEGGSARAEKSD